MQENKETNRCKLDAEAHRTIRCLACIIGLVAVFIIASFTVPRIINTTPKYDGNDTYGIQYVTTDDVKWACLTGTHENDKTILGCDAMGEE